MTKKPLVSTNLDHARNGSTLVLDVNEQLSYIVQESNIFITSHVWDVASEIDQGVGQLKTKRMQLKGQETASTLKAPKAPIKSTCNHKQHVLKWSKLTFMLGLGLARTGVTVITLCCAHLTGQIARRGMRIWQSTACGHSWRRTFGRPNQACSDWSPGEANGQVQKGQRWTDGWLLFVGCWHKTLENRRIVQSTWNCTFLSCDSSNLQLWELRRAESSTIFSEDCVFCLLVVSAPLMTINTECVFYSTFLGQVRINLSLLKVVFAMFILIESLRCNWYRWWYSWKI